MYVNKRTQRLDHWILDDVVGTGPKEQLMSDFEHMKTSLYLTDVVVLRNDGGAVNLLGLEITKTSRSFEVKNCEDNTSKDPFSQCENLQNLQGIHIQVKSEYVGTLTTSEVMTRMQSDKHNNMFNVAANLKL